MKSSRWIDLTENAAVEAIVEEISDKYYLNQSYFGCILISVDEVVSFFKNLTAEYPSLKGLYINDQIRQRNLYIDFVADFGKNEATPQSFLVILRNATFHFLEYVTDGSLIHPVEAQISVWFGMNSIHPEEVSQRIKLIDAFKRNFADQNVSKNV
ncbi:MAG: hypothetical protein Q7J34_13795 [Bacteroidales bacterium]|jgi:hypothetical protein|nr:hypothetical protein [Bacteroidales bacterium]